MTRPCPKPSWILGVGALGEGGGWAGTRSGMPSAEMVSSGWWLGMILMRRRETWMGEF